MEKRQNYPHTTIARSFLLLLLFRQPKHSTTILARFQPDSNYKQGTITCFTADGLVQIDGLVVPKHVSSSHLAFAKGSDRLREGSIGGGSRVQVTTVGIDSCTLYNARERGF